MSRLVIHPEDPTTAFLSPIHRADDTVIRGGVGRSDLEWLISGHDQTVMMGHGSPAGLLSVGQFDRAYAVDGYFADVLSETEATYIWCYASSFVKNHDLPGFATGMFVSDDWESRIYIDTDCGGSLVEESNQAFASILSSCDGPRQMYRAAYFKYGKLAKRNPVAAYNHERLYLAG